MEQTNTTPRRLCRYNVGIECAEHTGCESCGWNPAVAEERRRRARAKLGVKRKTWGFVLQEVS